MPVEIDVEKVALLARLALTPDEVLELRSQLGAILEHAAKVGEVATGDVEPTASAIPRSNVFRPDEPEPSLSHEDALANAPAREAERFRVPPMADME